jgi:hypothetical protein
MTVRELRIILEKADPNAEVHVPDVEGDIVEIFAIYFDGTPLYDHLPERHRNLWSDVEGVLIV